MLTLIGRILLLSLDEESRVAFDEIYEGFRSRHVPSYDYLGLVPGMRGKMPRQQVESVLQLMERISTPYISSYATMCLESLSSGRVNVELTPPTDLLLGIDNSTQSSLAMDIEETKNVEVPSTFHSAVSTVMNSVADDLIEPDLELVATLMVNIPNFDVTNPEVPESLRYVAKFMKGDSKPGDPVLEDLNREQTSGAERLVKVVLERMLVSDTATSVLREAVGQLLQNFHDLGNKAILHTRNITELFNIVSPDFYPRSVVAIAKYFQQNLDLLYDLEADLTSHATELQALATVVRKISNNSSLPESVREIALVLASFVAQKAREEEEEYPRHSIEDVNVKRAMEYLDAFRNPCLPEKLTRAAKRLRPYLDDQLPWGYAFGDTRLRGNPYELLMNGMIRLRDIDVSKKLGRVIDDFVYQTQHSGVAGKRSVLYDSKIIYQRGDTDLVELDVYTLLERLPGVFRDERFTPLLVFVSKPNLVDYLGRGFNMLAHTEPRSLLLELIRTALDKPAVKEDQALFKALKVSDYLLEQPTLDNKYTSEELEDIVKVLPAIDDDPRYLPIKLLFRKENLFKYISPSFSLAGLESPLQHVALVLKTVTLKPIDERLEKAIVFALTNLEGPKLRARSFNRDDFTYLVNNLLRHEKKMTVAILKSHIYKSISDWNIIVCGNPEDVLARALRYPVKELLRNRQIRATVKRAVKILEDQTPRKVDLLKRKILDKMLNYFPDLPDLRPVILLLKKANLATVLQPRLNISFLSEQSPRKGLIMVLQNLVASPRLKKETVLIKRMKMALNRVEESVDPPENSVSSIVTEELLNPLARKYEPLWAKFRVLNGNISLKYSRVMFRDFVLRLKNEKTDPQLSKAASLALQEINNDDSSQGIKDSEILEVLQFLPDNPIINQVKKLLSLSWIRNILPKGFRSSDYPRKDKILRIILFLTKQRPEVIENPGLVYAISVAERSLVSWKRDVEPLRKIVYAVKDTLYDPTEELLRPKSLNRLKLNFHFDFEQSPKQLMVGLLKELMANRKIKANSQVTRVLDGLQQDVLDFGLDEDLLWTLDDVGIPYKPSLAPVRMFLHTNMANSSLGHLVGRVSSPKKRFQIIRDYLSSDEHVHADKELLKSVHELARIKSSLKNSLGVTEADIMDIVKALPDEVVGNNSDVNELLRPEILKELPFRSEILDSGQPVKTLLMGLSRLPKVSGNRELSAKVAELYEALGDFVHQPVISGYNLRPLLRELNHTRQMNVDHILKIIDPKMLSVVLPDGLDDFDETQDDAELLNNILDEVLSQNVSEVDAVFKRHVLSMQRDLVTILTHRRKKRGKRPLSDRDVEEMMKLIPKTVEFKAIRYLIKAKDGFDMMPQSISSSKYPTPLKRLMKILDIMERNSGDKNDLHASVIALKSHLTRQYFSVTESDVEMLMNAINELSVYHNLVPLRLFLTVENLVKYLPSHIEFGRFESPQQALMAVLQILREIEELETNTMLQQSIAMGIAALEKVGSEEKVAGKNVTRTTFTELTIYDLRFLLNLDFGTSELEYYLTPENLINILPRDFSFASKPTFKSKVLHVLSYLESFKLGPRKEIEKMIQKMKLLNDFPVVDNAALERLVAAIDENEVGKNFDVIIKYLTVGELVKILPSDYRLKEDVRETLIELSTMVLLSLRESQTREIAAFEIFLIQLESPWLPLIKMRVKVTLTELKSLIAEIPFETCENIGNLSQNLKPDQVLEMFPDGFDLATFKTRKLKLLAILKVVTNHPGASKFQESVRVAIKCVEEMQDVPKLSNWNIGEILNATYIDKQDVITLLENCRAADLAEYLPITFDNRKVKSTRLRLAVVINYCLKLKHNDPAVDEALKRAKIYAKKLPLADLDRIGLMIMLDEICCCNFTSIKPFKVFAATENLLALLPPTMNLEKKPTFKSKVLALLDVIQNLKEFQSEEMIEALNTAVEAAHAFREAAIISKKDIEELKQLEVMMLPEVKPFAKVFVLRNFIKVLPSSFDINDYNTGETKLTHLIDYALGIPKVKLDNECHEAWRIVYRTLREQAEKEVLDFIETYSRQDDNLTQLLLYETEHKDQFFNQIWITHDYKYELIDDRVRVVLRYMLRLKKITNFKCLTRSINLLISRLSKGPPTEYEVLDAIEQLPDTNENRDLRIFLNCKDVKKRAKSTLNLTPDYSLKRILLHMLTMPQSPDVDKEIKAAIDRAIPELEKAIRDEEVEEILRELPNSEAHTQDLQAVRSYYVLHGRSAIFGTDYHSGSYDQLKMLHQLVNRLLVSPDIDRDKELKTQVKYMNEVLKNPTNEPSPGRRTTIQDIDITPMLSVLPKIRSEKLIFGLLKFFTDPKLPDQIGGAIDPSRFHTQGSLMKEIVDFGLNLDSVKADQNQLKALKYVRYKTLLTGFAAEPIRLKPPSRHARANPDLMCLLKAVDYRSANLSNLVPIARFFETEYDPLIHARGFDHTVHHTRGAYLRALLKHLITNADLEKDIERSAKVLVNFVNLNGPGAEPIDLNEDMTLADRVFRNEFSIGSNPQRTRSPDVSAHFRNHPQDPWKKTFTVEPGGRSTYEPSSFERLMETENDPSNLFENERSALRSSVNGILHSNRQTREARFNDEEPFDPETATFSPDKVLVDVKARLVKGPLKTESDEVAYITEEEAAKLGRKKHEPVRPLTLSSHDGLPAETDPEYEAIPHTVSKNPGQIDFVSRKLFIRNDTDPSLIRKPRDLKDDISIENDGNDGHKCKAVKNNLSEPPSAKYYAMPTTILEKDTTIFDVDEFADLFPVSENTATPGPSIKDKTKAFADQKSIEDSESRSARCYAMPTIILETEIVDENKSADSLPVPEALTLERSTDNPKTESPGPSSDSKSRTSKDDKSSGQLTDDITVEDFKAHVMEARKSPEGRVLAKRETSRDDEQHNTDNIDGSSSPGQMSDSIQDTDDGKQMIPQSISDGDHYEEVPVTAVTPDSGDYGNFQQPFPKIETIHTESIREKRSSDHGIPRVGIRR